MKDLQSGKILAENPGIETIDAAGKFVFPSFCDSHTHLVYAGSREMEFTDKIRVYHMRRLQKEEAEFSILH